MGQKYYDRIIDFEIKAYLEAFGAVLITGPKWCGKTTSAKQIAKSVIQLQDPDKINAYLKTIDVKPSLLLEGEKPRLIDEWQIAPVLWDAIRTDVDNKGIPGQYILTGSTTVDEKAIMHSGVGRIARLKMLPMSLYESNESNGKISLKELFDNSELNIDGIKSDLTIEKLIFLACRGGWPSSLMLSTNKSKLLVSKAYIDNIIESDISTVDGVKRNPNKVRRFLQSYSRNIGTIVKNTTIIDDIKANISFSESTYYDYFKALSRLYVIDEVPAWNISIRSKTSMRSSSKKMFIDPSIATASLSLSPDILLQDLNTFGFIFENLCFRDLKAYSMSLGGSVSYYRDRMNLEVDGVLHLDDSRYALIEFKLGSKEIEKAAKNLLKVNKLIEEKQLAKPAFLMIITAGEIAYTRPDGIRIVPIGCLKD